MSLLSNLFGAAIKTVFVPVAIVSDAVDVLTGEEPESTEALVKDAIKDVKDGVSQAIEGDVI